MRRLDLADYELSLLVVNDRDMTESNRRFFGKSSPTDVIAISQVEGAPLLVSGERLLGDVIVSWDAARRQAMEFGHSPDRELSILAVHGLLHTIGMDDKTPAQRRSMMARTRRLLA